MDGECRSGQSTNYEDRFSGSVISPVYLKQIKILEEDVITFNRSKSYGESYNNDPDLLWALGQSAHMGPGNVYKFYYLLPYSNPTTLMSKFKWYKLNSITGLSKSISLKYNELQPYDGGVNDRLHLMNVHVNDMKYQFEYNDISSLPKLLSSKTDHWGYFNSAFNFVPSGTIGSTNNFSNYYNQKLTNSQDVKKGSLLKIIYPTKGWSEFSWEPNSYSSYINDNKTQLITVPNTMAGGLRVKQIINNDGKGNNIIRDFKYVKNYEYNQNSTQSSGTLERNPKYYFENFRIKSHSNSNARLEQDVFSTTPLIPLGNSMGSHIGYSEVIEYQSSSGFSVYKYTSNNDSQYRDEYNFVSLNPDPSPYTSYTDKSLLRGKLKDIIIYNNDLNKVKRTSMSYQYDPIQYARGIRFKGETCSNVAAGFYQGNAYKMYFFDNNLTKEEVVEYDGNGNVLKTKTEYDWSYYPNTSITTGDQFLHSKKVDTYLESDNPDHESYTENYTYNFEEGGFINNSLVNDRYFTILQKDIYKNNFKIESSRVDYEYFGSDSAILPKNLLFGKGNNNLEVYQIVDGYDFYTKEVTKYHTVDGIYTYILNFNTYPTIQIQGKKLNASEEFFLNNTIGNSIKGVIDNHGWIGGQINIIGKQQQARDYFSKHMVTSYTYKPYVGVTSMTDPKGQTTYFEYSNNRLVMVKDDDRKTIRQVFYNFKTE